MWQQRAKMTFSPLIQNWFELKSRNFVKRWHSSAATTRQKFKVYNWINVALSLIESTDFQWNFMKFFFREKCPLVWSAAMKQTWFLGFFPGVECCEWFSGTSLAAGHVTSPQHSFIQICFSFFFVIMPFRCWCYSRHSVWPTESQDRRSVYLTKVSALLLAFNESFNQPSSI